jgi:40-residue YVTN family beta-propeller repeat
MKLRHLALTLAVGFAFNAHANEADRGKAYVSNQDGGVTVIDLNTHTSTGTIDVKGEGPRGLAISEDGKQLIVATRENGSISVIDTATNEVIKQIPVGKNPEFVRVRGKFAFVSYEPSAKGGPPPAPGSAAAKEAEKEAEDDDAEPARIGIIDLKLGKKVREIVGGP